MAWVEMVAWLVLWLIPCLAIGAAAFWALTFPYRRAERADVFLSLVAFGLNEGKSPEETLMSAARQPDKSLGRLFRRLGRQLEAGVGLITALDHVPALLPAGVVAMLRAGQRAGRLEAVLPTCRTVLPDRLSAMRGALNYVMVFIGFFVPATLIILPLFYAVILPKIRVILSDMGAHVPGWCALLMNHGLIFYAAWFVLVVVLVGLTLGYLGGLDWAVRWLPAGRRLVDGWALWFPWRRKRLQRNFAAVLCWLLDGGVSEAVALEWAGEATANLVLRRRAQAAAERLKNGAALVDVLTGVDGTGELRWRLANAARTREGFTASLRGWLGALDAKAFQLEQTAAHTITSAVVLYEGVVVAAFCCLWWRLLIAVLQSGIAW